jgi:hypothetical protein
LVLAPRISSYVLTDQPYVSRLVEQNIDKNKNVFTGGPAATGKGARRSSSSRKSKGSAAIAASSSPAARGQLAFRSLDWETDSVTHHLTRSPTLRSFDAVLCCDCIYNEALIDPLVQTCADICRLRTDCRSSNPGDENKVPCICVVAQQLRDSDVFEAWLARFSSDFDVWRVPDAQLIDGLGCNSGFVVHIGILKGSASEAA